MRLFAYKVERDADVRKFDGTARLSQVRTERVSPAVAYEVLARAGVKLGDALTEDTARRIREIARAWTSTPMFDSDGKGRIVLVLLTR